MKLINKDADYAIKALVEIAGRGREKADVPGLAQTLGLPRPYLRKILQTLARSGLLSSSRGKGGGFWLARPPARIRAIEIIGAFQGPVKIHDCLFTERRCPDLKSCPLRKVLGRLEARLVADLEAVTVAGLLAERSGPVRIMKKGAKR